MNDVTDNEYISMIDGFVAFAVREVVCDLVSKKIGVPVMKCRNYLMELIIDMNEEEDNIRCWFEKHYQ